MRAVRALDPYHGLRGALSEIAELRNDWAGIPIPLEGESLIIEPRYPHAEALSKIGPKAEDSEGWRLRNSWYSMRHRCSILVVEKDGKIRSAYRPGVHHIEHDLRTLGCSDVWGIEQEGKAVQLLGTMLRHRAFKQYLLTGMFIERSRRSGVTYIFRKLKPTIALAPARGDMEGPGRILACLCMHPIAYYDGSWAGAMVPTDDVIAHLSMMRGDEAMYWKRCNQIPPHRPEAGL